MPQRILQFRRPNLARDFRKVDHGPTAVPDELTEASRGLSTCARIPEKDTPKPINTPGAARHEIGLYYIGFIDRSLGDYRITLDMTISRNEEEGRINNNNMLSLSPLRRGMMLGNACIATRISGRRPSGMRLP